MKRRYLGLVVFVLAFFELGCKSVKSSDLEGTWLMKASSEQVIPVELRKGRPKISFDANGTFVATDMPGLLDSPPRLDSGSGVWRLGLSEGQQQVQLDFQTIANWEKTKLPYGTQLNVSREWSKVGLYYFIGDPDEARMIEFERK